MKGCDYTTALLNEVSMLRKENERLRQEMRGLHTLLHRLLKERYNIINKDKSNGTR